MIFQYFVSRMLFELKMLVKYWSCTNLKITKIVKTSRTIKISKSLRIPSSSWLDSNSNNSRKHWIVPSMRFKCSITVRVAQRDGERSREIAVVSAPQCRPARLLFISVHSREEGSRTLHRQEEYSVRSAWFHVIRAISNSQMLRTDFG